MRPIVHADVEQWLAPWIRARKDALVDGLQITLAWVSNTERPSSQGGRPKAGEVHVIVRDDSGPRRALLLKDAAVGITSLGISRSDLGPIKAFAERLVAVIEADAPLDLASPVADVPDVNGPYAVPSTNDEARVYAAVSLTLVGSHI